MSRYLSAVGAGDAGRALDLLGLTPEAEPTLLSDEFVQGAASLPTAIRIEDSERTGAGTAEVTASYVLDSATHRITLPVRRTGGGLRPHHHWQIALEQLPGLTVQVEGSPTVRISERDVQLGEEPAQVLFPVSYLVDLDSDWFQAQAQRAQVHAPGDAPIAVEISAEPKPELADEVERQIGEVLDGCAQATTLAPSRCPLLWETDDEILGEVSWEVLEAPPVTLTTRRGELIMPTDEGSARVSGRLRDAVSGEERDFAEEVTFFLGAEIAVQGGEVIVEPRAAGLDQTG